MSLTQDQALQLVKGKLWPLLEQERVRVHRIDRWMRWDHDRPHQPRQPTREYRELSERAQAPWGRRVVTAATDQLYVEGYRAADSKDDSEPWQWWQANGLDSRQVAIHESTVGYGLAYAVVVPGTSWLNEPMPVIRGLDPSQMIAVYQDPAWDDWPVYALRAEPQQVGTKIGWRLRLYDETDVHTIAMSSSGESITYVTAEQHNVGVCPVVRFTNHLDLRGRATGDIEPIISVLGRIDQTSFDRLVTQRFSSWKVRTISGMTAPEQFQGESQYDYERRTKLKLSQEDVLVADDPDTKFGTLPETALDGFISAHDADVRTLAALSQSPAHELIGQMANLSADALAAAEASLTRRVTRLQHPLGECWEQTLRLAAKIMDNADAAKDMKSQVVWADMESRSLAAAADALGKLAQMLGVPVEVLWEKIPGWTQTDVERAKALAEQEGGIAKIMSALTEAQKPGVPQSVPPAA